MKIYVISPSMHANQALMKHIALYKPETIREVRKTQRRIVLINDDVIYFRNGAHSLDGIRADVAVGYMVDYDFLEMITCASKETKRAWCLTDLEVYIDEIREATHE